MTRLIDADALKERIITPRANGKDLITELIDSMPTIDAEPHWILTGDVEPEHCHMVLISVFNAKTDMRFVDTGALYSDGWYGSGWKLPDYCIVTAWQELPKPYEVEE